MTITFTAGRFVALCSFKEKGEAKAAGFVWSGKARAWTTSSHTVVAALSHLCDGKAAAALTEAAGRPDPRDPLPTEAECAIWWAEYCAGWREDPQENKPEKENCFPPQENP